MNNKAKRVVASTKAATRKQQLNELDRNYLSDFKQVYFRLRAAEPKLFESVMHGDILAPGNWLSSIQQLRITGNMIAKYGDVKAMKSEEVGK
jgi:hypothetical protein